MRSRSRPAAAAVLLACLLAGCGTDSQPAPSDRPGHGAAAAENALRPGAAERPGGRRGPRHGRRGAPRRATARRAGRAGARGRARAERRGHAAVRDRPRALRAQRGARGRRSRRAGRDRHLRAGLQQAGAAGAAARGAAARLAASTPPSRCPVRSVSLRRWGTRARRPRELAASLGATRIALVSQRQGAAAQFESALVAAAAASGIEPVLELDASASTPQEIAGVLQDGHDPGRRAGRLAGHLGDRSPARDRAPAGGRCGPRSSPRRRSTRSRSSTAPEARPRACA